MFKIGEFSKLGQVSTRMLRHYDKLGLLVPNHVDSWTGYRYYTVEQVARLHRIIALKELGLSLRQISELLQDNTLSTERLRGMLTLKKSEIEQKIEADRTRLAHVETRLQQIEQQGQPLPYEVVVKSASAQTIASIRQVVGHISEMEFHCRALSQQLYQGLERHKIEPLPPDIALYHEDEYVEIDLNVEMAVPVDQKYLHHAVLDEKISFRELPAQEMMAALIYEGNVDGIGTAVLVLLTWVGTHQYTPSPPLREIRLSGSTHICDEESQEVVVELQIPVRSWNGRSTTTV